MLGMKSETANDMFSSVIEQMQEVINEKSD